MADLNGFTNSFAGSTGTTGASHVTDTHPQVLQAEPAWRRIQDAIAGTDAVRYGHYLPELPAHRLDPAARSAYVQRTVWYGASGRTVDALVGASHRREGIVTVPPRYAPRLDDITGRGDSFHNFSKTVTREVLTYGRYGLLIDVHDGEIKTAADRFPYIVGYNAFSVRNWRYRIDGGRRVLEQVVLREEVPVPAMFGSTALRQYRVLELDEHGEAASHVYQEVGGEWERVKSGVLRQFGRALKQIPFVFVGPAGTAPDVQKSPILDLVDVNYAHFRNSADYEHSLYLAGSPTVVITGAPEDFGNVQLGGAILLPAGADAKLLEYMGDGIGHLERALAAKQDLLATLGARLLESPKRAAETAETVRLRQYGDTSTLASVARSVSDAIGQAIQIACDWDGIGGLVSVELNQDFFDSPMEPAALAGLIKGVQAGLLPVDDFILLAQKGELIRGNLTVEQVRALLETDAPMVGGAPMRLDPADDEPDSDPPEGGGEVAA